jgi:hypothetical protein
MSAATAIVAAFGIAGTLASPFVANWGLERRMQLKHKHAEETRLRRARIHAYRNMLDAAISCRESAAQNSAQHRTQLQLQALHNSMQVALRNVLSAYDTVNLFGSVETRMVAKVLWDAARGMATTTWREQEELANLTAPVAAAEEAFAAAARKELFPDAADQSGRFTGQ